MKKSIMGVIAGYSVLALTAFSVQAAVNKTSCPMNLNCSMNSPMGFFQDTFSSEGPGNPASTYVKSDSNGSQIIIIAPGLTKNDFTAEIKGNILTVSAANPVDNKTKKPVNEIITNNFNFTYTVSKDINNDKITSDYQNGVLTVNLPLDKEKIKEETKTIQIK